MIRYVGPVVLASLLALSGCLAYPYGGYYGSGYGGYPGYGGYSGYGGYPSYGYPYNSGAPYCPPSYGYSYNPYGSQYGYGYGYSPGVVVPAPAPPVVVEDHIYTDDNSQYASGRRWRRHHAKEGFRDRYPDATDPASGDPATSPDPTAAQRQAARQWRREQFANRARPTENSPTLPGTLEPNQRLGPGSRTAGTPDPRAGAWQTGRNREQFTNRSMPTQNRMQAAPQMGSRRGAASATPQMRQNPMLQQQRGPAAAPRMRQAPSTTASPRPMMAGAGRSAPRVQAGQARPQANQNRGAAREGRLRLQ